MSFTFHIILRQEPEGGFTVIVPSLPGCITYGDTLDDAKEMAKDAIAGYLSVMREKNEIIIDDANTLETSIQVALA